MIARLKGLDLLSSTRFNSSRAGRRDARIRVLKYPVDLPLWAVVLSSRRSSRKAAERRRSRVRWQSARTFPWQTKGTRTKIERSASSPHSTSGGGGAGRGRAISSPDLGSLPERFETS